MEYAETALNVKMTNANMLRAFSTKTQKTKNERLKFDSFKIKTYSNTKPVKFWCRSTMKNLLRKLIQTF